MKTNQKLLVILAVITIVLIVTVQAEAIELSAGPKVMFGHFDAYGDDYADLLDSLDGSRKFSLTVPGGLFVEVGVSRFLAFQVEFLFNGGGGPKYEYEALSGPMEGTVQRWATTYAFEFPILIKGKYPLGSVALVAYGGAGPQVRIGTWKFKAESSNSTMVETELSSSDFAKDVGYALIGGAGVEFDIWRGTLMCDLRYTHGMTEWFADSNYKYRAFLLSVGYAFSLL
jgi:hypothetical protein